MASIRLEMTLRAGPHAVWDAVRDVGAIHARLAPDFVTDAKLEGDARIVTFANGMTAKELIVDIDNAPSGVGRGRRAADPSQRLDPGLPPKVTAAAWSGSPTSCRTNSKSRSAA